MENEKLVSLIKEIAKINKIESRNSKIGAIGSMVAGVLWMSFLIARIVAGTIDFSFWLAGVFFLIAFTLFASGFFILIRKNYNEKILRLMEIILEMHKSG